MAFFNKLFGKTADKKIVPHTEEWDTYITYVDNEPGSFLLDLGWRNDAPAQNKATLVWVELEMRQPGEDGLSSNEESNTLYAIEDLLSDALQKKHGAIYPGRLTSSGKRTFYYYMNDATLHDKTISDCLINFPSYQYGYGVQQDEEWSVYFNFMYPEPQQYQSMMNKRVLRNLEQSGDTLQKEREVDHWFSFKTEQDAQTFLSKISGQGFTTLHSGFKENAGEYLYELNISRKDNVDYESIDNCVLPLWQMAAETNGNYDGWGCGVVKESN